MSRRARRRSGKTGGNWLGRLLVILFAVCLLAFGGGYVLLRSYLHSDGFRSFLSAAVSRSAGVPGEFSPFRWDGLAVDTDGFHGEGKGPLVSLKADGLHTEVGFGGVKRGVWELSGTSVRKLEVAIDASRGAPEVKTEEEKKVPVSKKERPKRWYPSEVEVMDLEVKDADVIARLKDGRMVEAEGISAKAVKGKGNDEQRVVIDAGRLRMPDGPVPELEVRKIEARHADQTWFVTSAKVRAGDSGEIDATGEWDLREKAYAFEGNATGIPCGHLVSETWAKRLEGSISTGFTVQGNPSGANARGSLVLESGRITALPVLDALAAYADTRRFRELELTEGKADWMWTKDETRLTNVMLASEGLLRLEGDLTIRDGKLDGMFRLGIVPGVLSAIPGAETDVFLPGEKGMLWAMVKISGSSDDPKEDLTDRLMAVAGFRMFEQLPGGDKVLRFSQKILGGDTPEETIRRGKEAIKEGEDAVREAKDLLRGILGK